MTGEGDWGREEESEEGRGRRGGERGALPQISFFKLHNAVSPHEADLHNGRLSGGCSGPAASLLVGPTCVIVAHPILGPAAWALGASVPLRVLVAVARLPPIVPTIPTTRGPCSPLAPVASDRARIQL